MFITHIHFLLLLLLPSSPLSSQVAMPMHPSVSMSSDHTQSGTPPMPGPDIPYSAPHHPPHPSMGAPDASNISLMGYPPGTIPPQPSIPMAGM